MSPCAPSETGKDHPDHVSHDTVAGHDASVGGSVSRFSGQYTPAFVEAVLQQVPSFARAFERSLVHVVDEDLNHPQVSECLAASREDLQSDQDEAIQRALTKLHKNLGHPSTAEMVRILRHGQAMDAAVAAARKFSCEFCKSQVRPRVPLPAQSSRMTQFNQLVGVDVKFEPGWRPGQKVKSLNLVDQSSCYQQVIPFFEQETSHVIRKLFDEFWVRWAGPPDGVILDQAQTQVGEVLQGYLESLGTAVKFIPAEAHWQLGRTENHGGWFSRILEKVILEHSPSNREEWEQCVRIAHVKNQSIQSYGYTPHQHVFGKNPTLPGDLLSEPLHVVPGTAGLTDDAVAKAQAIRCTARQAVVSMQDDKALRLALSARVAPMDVQQSAVPTEESVPVPAEVDKSPLQSGVPSLAEGLSPSAAEPSQTYGPVRRRVSGKAGEPVMFRPPKMKEHDFVEMMKEIVPRMLADATQSVSDSSSSSSAPHGTKRVLDLNPDEVSSGPPASRAKSSDISDSLCVEHVHECLLVDEILAAWHEGGVESLMAAHLQKKLAKEIPPSGNDIHLQHLVDESKALEWETLIEKGAIKIHYGRKAHALKQEHPERFMGSRFVIIRKPVIEGRNIDLHDESTFKVKSRWCLQGHLDPDLDSKAMAGSLQSPTLSQMGRIVLMQLLASHKWQLQLGDIKAAFMEAGPLPDKYRPLFAHQPKGGIAGVPHDAVLEVVGNVYGQNDAPHAWYYVTFVTSRPRFMTTGPWTWAKLHILHYD
eukprot:s1179_g7.t1